VKHFKIILRVDLSCRYAVIIKFIGADILSMQPYLDFKPFNELRNITLFNTVKPAGLSIEWLHGQDICPDELYYNSVPA
jgi:hypothetical protein